MKILIKYPSRGRPKQFFEGMQSIYDNLAIQEGVHVACTLDKDDPSMNNLDVINRIESYPNTSIQWGLSESKIHAVNRDMPDVDFDVLVVMSDDMRFTFWGFDQVIRYAFIDKDFDRLLHIPDDTAKDALATMYIAGRDFYNRFGYIYHPSYKSLFCDNEIMDCAKSLGKYEFMNWPGVIEHQNPAYGKHKRDEMFDEQQQFWNVDEANYYERKKNGFPK